MFNQNNLLLNAVPMSLKMIRSKDSFSVVREASDTTTEIKIHIDDVRLMIRRVKLFQTLKQEY